MDGGACPVLCLIWPLSCEQAVKTYENLGIWYIDQPSGYRSGKSNRGGTDDKCNKMQRKKRKVNQERSKRNCKNLYKIAYKKSLPEPGELRTNSEKLQKSTIKKER